MSTFRLNPEDLRVSSFSLVPDDSFSASILPDCCTGCDSGCGIRPTNGGCESESGQAICPADPILLAY